jgi:hypothetical protein
MNTPKKKEHINDTEDFHKVHANSRNGNGDPDDTEAEEIERENGDKHLIPDEDDDDFEETYGDLEGGKDDQAIPDPEKSAENFE